MLQDQGEDWNPSVSNTSKFSRLFLKCRNYHSKNFAHSLKIEEYGVLSVLNIQMAIWSQYTPISN